MDKETRPNTVLEAFINEYGVEDGTELFEKLEKQYYEPSQTNEWYDSENDQYYNIFGQQLRTPDIYDISSEDSFDEPFGDE